MVTFRHPTVEAKVLRPLISEKLPRPHPATSQKRFTIYSPIYIVHDPECNSNQKSTEIAKSYATERSGSEIGLHPASLAQIHRCEKDVCSQYDDYRSDDHSCLDRRGNRKHLQYRVSPRLRASAVKIGFPISRDVGDYPMILLSSITSIHSGHSGQSGQFGKWVIW